MQDLISETDLSAKLKKCAEWDLDGSEITRTIEFESFTDAIDFVNDLAEIAEDAQHHPDIDIRYNRVTLHLTTHEKSGLTDSDFEMAHRIDNLAD